MNFTIIDAEQRSPEWYAARAARVTGSCAHKILAVGKAGAPSVQRRDYRLQLACEQLTGKAQEGGYINAEMQHGIDMEPKHLAHYEAVTGNMVRKTGFLSHNIHPAGCSLDGDIDNFTGLWEGKAPKTATHIGYVKDPNLLLIDYKPQVLHNLWIVPQARWLDLTSFDDRLPAPLQFVQLRIMRGAVESAIQEYEREIMRFLAEVSIEVRELTDLMKVKEAA